MESTKKTNITFRLFENDKLKIINFLRTYYPETESQNDLLNTFFDDLISGKWVKAGQVKPMIAYRNVCRVCRSQYIEERDLGNGMIEGDCLNPECKSSWLIHKGAGK